LHLFPSKKSGWTASATTCSAVTGDGIEKVWETINDYLTLTKSNYFFDEKRKEQNQYWMMETIVEALKINFFQHQDILTLLESNKKAVANNEISPFAAAQNILKIYWSKK